MTVHASHTRAEIISIARSWIGTPYHHQESVKGAGCDCLGLVRGVFRELYGFEAQDVPAYSRDWAEAGGLRHCLRRGVSICGQQDMRVPAMCLFSGSGSGPWPNMRP